MGKEENVKMYFKPGCPHYWKCYIYFKNGNIIKFTSYSTEGINCEEENTKKLKKSEGRCKSHV